MKKIPYMLIVGEKEELEERISVRKHGKGDQGSYPVQAFIDQINSEIREALNP
jgi:threonyl-tRNA synthetase